MEHQFQARPVTPSSSVDQWQVNCAGCDFSLTGVTFAEISRAWREHKLEVSAQAEIQSPAE